MFSIRNHLPNAAQPDESNTTVSTCCSVREAICKLCQDCNAADKLGIPGEWYHGKGFKSDWYVAILMLEVQHRMVSQIDCVRLKVIGDVADFLILADTQESFFAFAPGRVSENWKYVIQYSIESLQCVR